jgi:hypothetical protein
MFVATIKLFSFLINPEFWTRTGFFVGYILAFLLVLEVVRLASTDANRKEAEKLLDAYAASRNNVPVRRRSEETEAKKVVHVSIDELEDMERRRKGHNNYKKYENGHAHLALPWLGRQKPNMARRSADVERYLRLHLLTPPLNRIHTRRPPPRVQLVV